jgi:hypothetical protein
MENEKVVAVVDTTLVVEITEEELAYLMRKREKDAHNAKRESYVDEMNNLFARAKRDGFTFATSNRCSLSKVESWGDASGNWIRVA